jgi:hypothetical protein
MNVSWKFNVAYLKCLREKSSSIILITKYFCRRYNYDISTKAEQTPVISSWNVLLSNIFVIVPLKQSVSQERIYSFFSEY